MVGKQFEQIVSFSLTTHTWELDVTSEVERKMILLGHQISYVIYYQLQGHFTIMFNVLFGFCTYGTIAIKLLKLNNKYAMFPTEHARAINWPTKL
jgi:hypothetical protein